MPEDPNALTVTYRIGDHITLSAGPVGLIEGVISGFDYSQQGVLSIIATVDGEDEACTIDLPVVLPPTHECAV